MCEFMDLFPRRYCHLNFDVLYHSFLHMKLPTTIDEMHFPGKFMRLFLLDFTIPWASGSTPKPQGYVIGAKGFGIWNVLSRILEPAKVLLMKRILLLQYDLLLLVGRNSYFIHSKNGTNTKIQPEQRIRGISLTEDRFGCHDSDSDCRSLSTDEFPLHSIL